MHNFAVLMTYISDKSTSCGDAGVYSCTKFLLAPHCNAQNCLSAPALTGDLIDIATEHANALGIGYEALIPEGYAWVLSRLAFFMNRFPAMHETYTIDTWIESFNRSFSNRNFRISIADTGEVLGYARSVWTAIDIRERRLADLSKFTAGVPLCPELPCQVPQLCRLPVVSQSNAISEHSHVITSTDIDFNRHVNTTRYVEMLVNIHDLAFHDANRLASLEMSFRHEALYGNTLSIFTDMTGCSTITYAIEPTMPLVVARQTYVPRI